VKGSWPSKIIKIINSNIPQLAVLSKFALIVIWSIGTFESLERPVPRPKRKSAAVFGTVVVGAEGCG
jgi:hypothetical protein